jgi:hypothetical protein
VQISLKRGDSSGAAIAATTLLVSTITPIDLGSDHSILPSTGPTRGVDTPSCIDRLPFNRPSWNITSNIMSTWSTDSGRRASQPKNQRLKEVILADKVLLLLLLLLLLSGGAGVWAAPLPKDLSGCALSAYLAVDPSDQASASELTAVGEVSCLLPSGEKLVQPGSFTIPAAPEESAVTKVQRGPYSNTLAWARRSLRMGGNFNYESQLEMRNLRARRMRMMQHRRQMMNGGGYGGGGGMYGRGRGR